MSSPCPTCCRLTTKVSIELFVRVLGSLERIRNLGPVLTACDCGMVADIINAHAHQLARWLTTSNSSNFRIESEAVTLANHLEYMEDSDFVDLANMQGFDPSDEEKLAAGLAHADTIIKAFCEQDRKHAYRARKITTMIDQHGVHLYVAVPGGEEQAIVLQAMQAQLNAANTALAAANAANAALVAANAANAERAAAANAALAAANAAIAVNAEHAAAATAERDAAIAQLEIAKERINRLEFVVLTQRAELALLRPLAVKALHAKALTTDFLPLNRPRSSCTRTRTTPMQMGTLSPGLTVGKDDATWLDG
ncbi:hypothetical protein HDU88_007635 [Geranomyces variabilis]|nr:hypothetical protein HDU88_007635 [Geranomyces variabilis]